MAFSSAIVLSDLNDYIAPSQACIKPVEINKSTKNGPSEIKVDQEGGYYEISHDDGQETKLEKASITLNDCLACSGCVTSAESVLISMQSLEEFHKIISQKSYPFTVISISPQSRASLAVKYGLSPIQVHKKLVYFFKHHLGIHHVFDTAFTQDLTLVESANEFIQKFRHYLANGGQELEQGTEKPRRGQKSKVEGMPLLASSCPGWVCYAEKTHGEILPLIATTKSPQQMMGSLVKDYLAGQLKAL
ncbi:iron hydrogenase [Sporodiniella umbellata]|nr:iron hydrogenase [Sporodiniella umbellata]